MENTYTYKPTVNAIQYTGSIDKVIEFIGRENIENFKWRNEDANFEHIEISIRGKNFYRLFVDYYLVKHTCDSGEVRYETMDQLTFDVNFDKAVYDTTESAADATPKTGGVSPESGGAAMRSVLKAMEAAKVTSAPCEVKPEQGGRVAEGEWYYYVRSFGRIDCVQDRRLFCDDDRYKMGNYFRTEPEALQALDEWLLQLKYRQWRKQHDPVVLDWANGEQEKWSIQRNHNFKTTECSWAIRYQTIGALYFSATDLAERFYNEHKDLIHNAIENGDVIGNGDVLGVQ